MLSVMSCNLGCYSNVLLMNMYKDKIRILQLGKFYPIRGGVEKVMYDLTAGLAQYGISCDMLCAAYKGKGRRIELSDKSQVIVCRTLTRIAGTMISPSLLMKAISICRSYDVIHVHHPDPMACLALFCARFKGKVILHWHSDIVKQKAMLQFYRPLQRWLIRRADLIIGTTPVYLTGSPYLRKAQNKTVYLPIGIDPVVPVPQDVERIRRRYAGKKIVFSLGRLVHYKGFSYLIKAAAHLDDDYVVLIGGEGVLKDCLEAEIKSMGLQEKVVLLGRIPDDELAAYYGACDLFCLSSVQKTEAFGIVQIEAMSCGKPVVATNIKGSGVSWVNEHGVSGVNVAPMDAKALAEAIRAVTCNEETYKKYSQGALERFHTVFTYKTMIDNYLQLLKKVYKK